MTYATAVDVTTYLAIMFPSLLAYCKEQLRAKRYLYQGQYSWERIHLNIFKSQPQ